MLNIVTPHRGMWSKQKERCGEPQEPQDSTIQSKQTVQQSPAIAAKLVPHKIMATYIQSETRTELH